MLLRDGIKSTVLDRRELGREASWAGAGLIAPLSENRAVTLHPTVALRSWSAELFPRWSAELREETGIDNGYRRSGGVDVAWTAAEEHELLTTAGRWKIEGIVHERLAAGDRLQVEPALNPDLALVYFLPDRAQVRNPWHLRALGTAAAGRGVQLMPWTAVDRLETRGDKVTAVRTSAGVLACGWVIMAAGPWSGGLLGEIGVHAPTPPLKGQIVLLRQDPPLLSRIVEHGKNYLVPRGDGHILIGATEEHAGFDTRSTSAAVRDLLTEAIRLCPVLGQAQFEASWAGLRPGSIDTKPYIGMAPGFRNLVVATGHKRAGLQLSPATAELVAALVLGRQPGLDLASFRVDRDPDTAADSIRS